MNDTKILDWLEDNSHGWNHDEEIMLTWKGLKLNLRTIVYQGKTLRDCVIKAMEEEND